MLTCFHEMWYIYRERETCECRTPPPPPLHRPTMAMSELRDHFTSPPYQLKTVMIGILGSATRVLPCHLLLISALPVEVEPVKKKRVEEDTSVAHKIKVG
ncbi:hypothetical protein Hanom_Chr04g00345061 [Helianthus anomalus]